MSQAALTQETYLPESDRRDVDRIHDFLETQDATNHGRYFLVGATSPEGQVELPAEIYRVVRQVVDALRQGLAVTVAPLTQTLTTQQAADLLAVSRPTVIKLLDDGRIPFERVGSRRRILLRDLLSYREHRRAQQYAALEATSVSLDDEEDLAGALVRMRAARRAVAGRRNGTDPDTM